MARSFRKWLYRSRPEGFKKDGRMLAPWWIHALPGKVTEAPASWWVRFGKASVSWTLQVNRNVLSDGWSASIAFTDYRSLKRKA